jgi:hypothetical protein
VDTLDALPIIAEADDKDGSKSNMMVHARRMHAFFRDGSNKIGKSNCTCLFISQTKTSPNPVVGKPAIETMLAENPLKFNCVLRFRVKRADLDDVMREDRLPENKIKNVWFEIEVMKNQAGGGKNAKGTVRIVSEDVQRPYVDDIYEALKIGIQLGIITNTRGEPIKANTTIHCYNGEEISAEGYTNRFEGAYATLAINEELRNNIIEDVRAAIVAKARRFDELTGE